jgi:hypothetical protein
MIFAATQKHRFRKAVLTLPTHREPTPTTPKVHMDEEAKMPGNANDFPSSSKGGETDKGAAEDVCGRADIGKCDRASK